MQNINLIFTVVCFGLLITVFELLRRKHLREKYAILWLAIVVFLPVVFFNSSLINKISVSIGIMYPPTLVLIAAIIGLLLLVLMLSVIDSHQTDRIIRLTQRLAILEKKIYDISNNKREK